MKDKSGTLYVVATPIGNLEDLSRRAERVLSEVDLIAAEDTRRTRKLLSHLGIQKPLVSYYEPKEESVIPRILASLSEGRDVALVTDGGTPAISDPGYRLVSAAHEAGIAVIPVPGPSALAAALSAAGLPTDRVSFLGFLPAKQGARKKLLLEVKERPDTLVFYESPKRLIRFIEEAIEAFGDREAVVWREITKVYEQRIAGSLSSIKEQLTAGEVKGEITVLIRGAEKGDRAGDQDVGEIIRAGLENSDLSDSMLAAKIARETGRPRKEIYAEILKIKNKA